MRTMKCKNTGNTLNVTKHIITKNFWEYYVTDNVFDKEEQIVQCLVMGQETEIGDVSLNEIKPYILSQTNDLSQCLSAPGWQWVK